MVRVIEDKEAIEIQSYLSPGQRVSFFLASLFPLLAPYELIIRPDWHTYLSWFFLFAGIVAARAMAVSVFLLWAAIAGLDSKLRFDRASGTLTYSAGAPAIRWRTQQCSIRDIARLQVEEHDWTEGAPSYSFVTHMADGRSFKSGSSWSREEIENIVRRVSAFLGFSPST